MSALRFNVVYEDAGDLPHRRGPLLGDSTALTARLPRERGHLTWISNGGTLVPDQSSEFPICNDLQHATRA